MSLLSLLYYNLRCLQHSLTSICAFILRFRFFSSFKSVFVRMYVSIVYSLIFSRDSPDKWWLFFELHTKWSINGLSCILFTYCSSRFFILHHRGPKHRKKERAAIAVVSWLALLFSTMKMYIYIYIQFVVLLVWIGVRWMLISVLLFGPPFHIVSAVTWTATNLV